LTPGTISRSNAEIQRAAEYLRRRLRPIPDIGIILGSGNGALADAVEEPVVIPYKRIPHWPVSTVKGHAGSLFVGMLGGRRVAVMRGRTHIFEGYPAERIAFSVRVLRRLGLETLIVTNAAGAVNPDFSPGELMLITDQLNLAGLGGANPLFGPNDDRLGPRFLDMSQAYDVTLRAAVLQAAAESGVTLRQGVYAFLAGPTYETPAELKFLRSIGADAVGMSTVPETIVARHGGMRVLGISVISNRANLDGLHPPEHDEVLKAVDRAVPRLLLLLQTFLRKND
jgi:purine-nucleoside phosphorylase